MNLEHLIDLAAKATYAVHAVMPWVELPADIRDYYRDRVRPAVEAIAPLLDCGLTDAERDAARLADPPRCRNGEPECAACDEHDYGRVVDATRRRVDAAKDKAAAEAARAERLSDVLKVVRDWKVGGIHNGMFVSYISRSFIEDEVPAALALTPTAALAEHDAARTKEAAEAAVREPRS